MARPIKNNADYFPHDADMRNDPRIKALRRKFGIEGYGIYSMMLEFLTDAEFFEFKNDPLTVELVAGDFDITPEKLLDILQYCYQLDLFQLDAKTNIISCKSLDNRLEPLLSKRKRDRTVVIADDNTQSKVKESKEKESNGISFIFDLESNPDGLSVTIKESGLIAVRIFKQSFEKYLTGTFAQYYEQQKMSVHTKPPIDEFFKTRNGDIFNSPQHLWSSFKKLWVTPLKYSSNNGNTEKSRGGIQ